MIEQTGYLNNFFKTNEILCSIMGLWLYDSVSVSKWKKYLQIFLISTECTTAGVFLTLQFLILNETYKDVIKFFSHIGLLLSNALGAFKVAVMVFQRRKFRKIMDTLHDKTYEYESSEKFNPSLIFAKEKRFTQLCSISIYCMYAFVGLSAHVSVAATIRKEVNGTRFEGDHRCQDFVPYYFLIPFEVDTTTKCDYVLFFMDVSVFFSATLVGCLNLGYSDQDCNSNLDCFTSAFLEPEGYDGFLAALLNCVKTQLVILRDAIRSIRERVTLKLDLDENLENMHDESTPKLEEELYDEFTHLIKHLTIILRISDELEKLYNLMILAQTLTSLFNVASCLFSASREPVGSAVFFATLVYFMSILVEFGVVCWFGGEITTASEDIMFALYEIDWFSASPRFKKSLILTMCRMQRPVYLSIGKFFPLTLSAMVSVCKASFSYYTVFSGTDE